MMHNDIASLIKLTLPSVQLLRHEPMSKHTSFKIGGPADLFLIPANIRDFIELVTLIRERKIPYFILGNGSNILVSDKGIRSAVIDTTSLTGMQLEGTSVKVDCGTELETLTQFVAKNSLTGFEFAYGIPGTVGGAVTMNAGAYGGEIKDILKSSTVLTTRGRVQTLSREKMQFAYRQSVIQQSDLIVLSAEFQLHKGVFSQINEKMDELHEQRWTKQPMDLPSGGSVFKRPEGHYTGQLVDECSLRGYRIGEAAISDKHCGFIVNTGNATAQDVLALIEYTQKTVLERFGVTLERELKLVGDWS